MLSPKLLEILCCPLTKQSCREATVAELENINKIISTKGGMSPWEAALLTQDGKTAYPIRNGIPVMLAEEGLHI